MNYELALALKTAGFPQTTRWAVENNMRRRISVTGKEEMPWLQELISELPKDICLVLFGGDGLWFAENNMSPSVQEDIHPDTPSNIEHGYAGKTFYKGYIDSRISGECYGSTPEEAVANLWLALQDKK